MTAKRKARLVLLSIVALILFNFPIIGMVSDSTLVAGLPKLYLYFFTVWLIIIVLTFFMTHRKE